MRALVVFESMFGNTQAIAEAVADGLTAHLRVDLVEVAPGADRLGAHVAGPARTPAA
jgi:flavodoxin